MTAKKNSDKDSTAPPVWEWILAALGAVLIAGAIGTTLYRAATQTETPASFEVEVVSTTPAGASYAVHFKVKNKGSHTAAAVSIEGTLERGSEEIESSNASVTYIPPNSEREATLFFSKNPQDSEMMIRVTGYERP